MSDKKNRVGRPDIEKSVKKEPFPIRIAQWRIDRVDAILEVTGESRAALVEKALDSYCNLEAPK